MSQKIQMFQKSLTNLKIHLCLRIQKNRMSRKCRKFQMYQKSQWNQNFRSNLKSPMFRKIR